MEDKKFAGIIVNISHESVDRPFTYLVPENLKNEIEIGTSVKVPFGQGSKIVKGVVISFPDSIDFPIEKCKEICEVCKKDVSFSDSRIELAAWIKRNYGSTMTAALKTVLPVKTKIKEKTERTLILNVSRDELSAAIDTAIRKNNAAQVRLLCAFESDDEIPESLVVNKLHIAKSTINRLCTLNLIRVEEERVYRTAFNREYDKDFDIKLSDEQQAVIDKINEDVRDNKRGVYLIHGITGSGKTEVYMQAIRDTLARGEQAIVLIPEIALTFQTLMRFYKRFGNIVSVMNSTLTPGEKYDQFERAQKGEIQIMIGPRSALFTPFPNLGLIVIDEEHEGTYKSENMPRFHARETAIELARMSNAGVILGSATPSIDSYYKAMNGEYTLFKLTKRLTGNTLPNATIVDLREELKSGNRSILSNRLQELIADRLSKKEQVMLFLNRRGVAGFVSCRACGFVVKCPHCDVSLSEHKGGKMVCHYCGYTIESYSKCPKCGSKYILGWKAGTEQVEDVVNKMYPQARTLRMDADTTKDRDSYEEILSSFLNHEADILIGTQMIVKGHDFKNVTLVGILAADMSLFAADYRAAEKTFQLLTQGAGRAGRGDKPGDVVIQTYQPDNYAITYAAKQDYEGFYEEESSYRDLLEYPPVAHMLCVMCTAVKEEAAQAMATTLSCTVRENFETRLFGPAPATISKINDVYRFVFYIKEKKYDNLVNIKDFIENYLHSTKTSGVNVFFDFDPQSLM